MRKFNKEDLLEMDFKAYLASSSDEEETREGDESTNEDHDSSDDEDKKIDKYKVGFPPLPKVELSTFTLRPGSRIQGIKFM